jgi:hypothetical protein
MAIVVRYPPSNVSRDQYESVRSALSEAGHWPADGCQIHVCFGDSDDIRVSEIWESQEKLEAFGETLQPFLEDAGIQLAGDPDVFEAHHVDIF